MQAYARRCFDAEKSGSCGRSGGLLHCKVGVVRPQWWPFALQSRGRAEEWSGFVANETVFCVGKRK